MRINRNVSQKVISPTPNISVRTCGVNVVLINHIMGKVPIGTSTITSAVSRRILLIKVSILLISQVVGRFLEHPTEHVK